MVEHQPVHTNGNGSTPHRPEPSPATAPLSRRLQFRRWTGAKIWMKLAVIAVVFAIPLATTTRFLLQEKSIKIDFARNELRGDEYLRPASSVLQGVVSYRSAVRSGASTSDLATARSAVDDAFADLTRVDAKLSGPMLTTSAELASRGRSGSLPSTMAASWSQIKANGADAGAQLDQLVVDLRVLITEVGDASQLILDPDLDTYYTMDALLLREPEIVNRGHDVADGLTSSALTTEEA